LHDLFARRSLWILTTYVGFMYPVSKSWVPYGIAGIFDDTRPYAVTGEDKVFPSAARNRRVLGTYLKRS
jgi:hypothetical protein